MLLGNGSDELIQLLVLALNKPGATLLSVEPSFVMYKMIATFTGMRYVGVPLAEDFSLVPPVFRTPIAVGSAASTRSSSGWSAFSMRTRSRCAATSCARASRFGATLTRGCSGRDCAAHRICGSASCSSRTPSCAFTRIGSGSVIRSHRSFPRSRPRSAPPPDRPDALAELLGIVQSGGLRRAMHRVEELRFAEDTPFATVLRPRRFRARARAEPRRRAHRARGAGRRGRERHGRARARRLRLPDGTHARRSAARRAQATTGSRASAPGSSSSARG